MIFTFFWIPFFEFFPLFVVVIVDSDLLSAWGDGILKFDWFSEKWKSSFNFDGNEVAEGNADVEVDSRTETPTDIFSISLLIFEIS